jgi:hypothetical protein
MMKPYFQPCLAIHFPDGESPNRVVSGTLPRAESLGDVMGDVLGVRRDAVDEGGLAGVLEAQTHGVESGRGGNAAHVRDLAARVEDRHV